MPSLDLQFACMRTSQTYNGMMPAGTEHQH